MAVDINSSGLSPFYEKIDKLSGTQKTVIFVISILAILALFVGLLYYPNYKKIKKLEQEYKTQKAQLATAQKNASQLETFRAKKEQAEIDFKIAAKKLPAKEEIPSLLAMISNSGQRVGLEFQLFEPKPEKGKGFYMEIPVAIKVTGSYHQTAQFFDRVARLPRVVNIQNISIKPIQDKNDLQTACTAVTYKFIDTQPVTK